MILCITKECKAVRCSGLVNFVETAGLTILQVARCIYNI